MFAQLGSGGAICPPTGTDKVSTSDNFIAIPLHGEDTVIYVCKTSVLVGRCVQLYESSSVRAVAQEWNNFRHACPGRRVGDSFICITLPQRIISISTFLSPA